MTLALVLIVSGLDLPVEITHANDGSHRLFVVEQMGRIRIVRDGAVDPRPFLDIAERVRCCGEQGLLGLAFPPDYAESPRFYVNYTDVDGATVVSRFTPAPGDSDLADPSSETILLRIPQPFENHNGGKIAFSPRDGQLYIGMGDGGAGGDPYGYAQNPDALLGKLLRLDVNAPDPSPEIWALGLRNPWRFSFDRATSDLYIGDVGQNEWEEIDFQPADSPPGENFGWNMMEGFHCYEGPCSFDGLTLPVAEYSHDYGCSVTGGYVYRGQLYPELDGTYFYADYCNGSVWSLRRENDEWKSSLELRTGFLISTFGEDEDGEVYLTNHATGQIYRMVVDREYIGKRPL